MTIYISGHLSENKKEIICPLQSSVVLFIAKYCEAKTRLIFVTEDHTPPSNVCIYKIDDLSSFCVDFSSWQNLPNVMKNVTLPSVYQSDQKLVRSGLCVILRHIISDAHHGNPSLNLIDLLGFRQGSMKMCAEVSSWTKLCEVDIPESVTELMGKHMKMKIEDDNSKQNILALPSELMTLEKHFKQKCKVHNDNKRQRAEISQLKDFFHKSVKERNIPDRTSSEEVLERLNAMKASKESDILFNAVSFDNSHILISQTRQLSHGVRKFKVKKNLKRSEAINSENRECNNDTSLAGDNEMKNHGNEEKISNKAFDFSDLKDAVLDLSFMDIEYERVYSEGIELSIADLILITYVYYMLNVIEFAGQHVLSYLPCLMTWTQHMTSLTKVRESAHNLGWNLEKLRRAGNHLPHETGENETPNDFHKKCVMVTEKEEEEEVELTRCAKMKHKALKPAVLQTLQKFEKAGIKPVISAHPKGEDVQVDWSSLPSGVHPKEGFVPVKRTQRKCQQLENLVTAVQSIAKPGDVIVDFCSGGGHLGIVCAYLLPQCQVYLVENKEESLLKSSSRLESLELDNVTLYQCNMDYFIGKFDIGLCLHACGSATDMVLELCVKSKASFVICPCCYGGIHNTHLLSYPRSRLFHQADILYTDFLTVGHAADQTEFDIKLEKQGRTCMNVVDTDRAEYAKELGYDVILCTLTPLTCSPKNNLLIGTLKD